MYDCILANDVWHIWDAPGPRFPIRVGQRRIIRSCSMSPFRVGRAEVVRIRCLALNVEEPLNCRARQPDIVGDVILILKKRLVGKARFAEANDRSIPNDRRAKRCGDKWETEEDSDE